MDEQVRLRRYLRFLGCPRDAVDDLVQEVQLAALRARPAARGDVPVSWLLATARNQLRKHWRTLGRRRERADIDRLDRMWRQHVEDGGDERLDALRSCLQSLPARSRAVLRMRYGDGLARDRIAQRLGLGVEGTKSLLARVRAALVACIDRRIRARR